MHCQSRKVNWTGPKKPASPSSDQACKLRDAIPLGGADQTFFRKEVEVGRQRFGVPNLRILSLHHGVSPYSNVSKDGLAVDDGIALSVLMGQTCT